MENKIENILFKERRRFPRFPFRITVFCTDSFSHKVHEAKAYDISSHGIRIVSDAYFVPGSRVELCIHMPDNGEQVRLGAEVVWSKIAEDNLFMTGISILNDTLKAADLALRSIQANL